MRKNYTHTRKSLRAILNTSPIIALAKLGVLNKVLNLFSKLEIPSRVLERDTRGKCWESKIGPH